MLDGVNLSRALPMGRQSPYSVCWLLLRARNRLSKDRQYICRNLYGFIGDFQEDNRKILHAPSVKLRAQILPEWISISSLTGLWDIVTRRRLVNIVDLQHALDIFKVPIGSLPENRGGVHDVGRFNAYVHAHHPGFRCKVEPLRKWEVFVEFEDEREADDDFVQDERVRKSGLDKLEHAFAVISVAYDLVVAPRMLSSSITYVRSTDVPAFPLTLHDAL